MNPAAQIRFSLFVLWFWTLYTISHLSYHNEVVGDWAFIVPVLCAVMVMRHLSFRDRTLWSDRGFIAALLFAILSTLVSYCKLPTKTLTLSLQIHVWFFFFSVPILGFMVPRVLKAEDYYKIFSWMVMAVAVTSTLCVLIFVLDLREIAGYPLSFTGFRRENFIRYSIFINRSFEAYLLAWSLPLALVLKEKTGKAIWAYISVLLSFHLLVSFCRAAQLAAVIALIPIWMHLYRNKRRQLFFILLTLIGTAVFLLWSEPFAQLKYVTTIFDSSDRIRYWQRTLVLLFSSSLWLTGAGFLGIYPMGFMPHNSLLSIWLYYGMGGLLGFVFAAYSRLRGACKAMGSFSDLKLHQKLIAFVPLGILTSAMALDDLSISISPNSIVFWMALGALPVLLKPCANDGN